ncbi:hypothetical protein ACFU44_34670, partial [Nocardia rhizosphaerihabitans]|uniref:hypothetical protein n=1 Tax=Nocardia rhizosphaerihabitans TaxID=1691570 RepID=UPI00366E966C
PLSVHQVLDDNYSNETRHLSRNERTLLEVDFTDSRAAMDNPASSSSVWFGRTARRTEGQEPKDPVDGFDAGTSTV